MILYKSRLGLNRYILKPHHQFKYYYHYHYYNNNYYYYNYWKYAKHQLEKITELLPTFSKATCFEYFSNLFKKKSLKSMPTETSSDPLNKEKVLNTLEGGSILRWTIRNIKMSYYRLQHKSWTGSIVYLFIQKIRYGCILNI